jgi:hypothetical protein
MVHWWAIFNGKKDLDKGIHCRLIFFVLAMEGLSLLLEEVAHSHLFTFHAKCNLIKLHHLCFAVDLLIFSKGSIDSVQAILVALNEFEELSGLKANPSKSSVFLAGVPPLVKQEILHVLQMP